LVVPAQEYSDSITVEQPFDYTGLFIANCGSNHFYINTSTTGNFLNTFVHLLKLLCINSFKKTTHFNQLLKIF